MQIPMKNSVQLKLLAALLVLLSITAGSCGLPKILYLYPPKSFYASGNNAVMLVHDTQNYDVLEGTNQSFKGYEIYYRIYDTVSKAENGISLLNNKMTANPNSPDIVMSYALNTLKYSRMKNIDTSSQPLIFVTSPENNAEFELSLNQVSNWEISGDSLGSSIHVVRPISDSTRQDFFNKNNYLVADADFDGSADNPENVYIVLFAVAYAKDPDTIGQIVYSQPAVMSAPIQF